jgi:hypothetical protein
MYRQALASHPDHLLRSQILRSLRDHWFELSVAGWHDVVVGLIREKQIELAIDHLERMRERKLRVQDWLYSLIIYTLCDLKEFGEVVRLLRVMINEDISIHPTLWYYVLDTASQSFNVCPYPLFLHPRLNVRSMAQPPSPGTAA